MADGGVSTMIMLVTALLVTGSVSAILITEWSDATQRLRASEQKASEAADYDVAFAGDPMMVTYDTSTPGSEEIVFFLQNTGAGEMSTTFELRIDGEEPTSLSTNILPSGASWLPGTLLEVTATSNFAFADGSDVSLLYIGLSEATINGHVHTVVVSEEVRLNEI